MNKTATALSAAGFLGCILAANYVTTRYGMVPVGFGLTATAGTYFAGLSFALRDSLQDTIRKGLPNRVVYVESITQITTPGGIVRNISTGFTREVRPPRRRDVAARVVAVIAAGALLSLALALTIYKADAAHLPPGVTPVSIATASAIAFMIGETLDLAVYTPLRDKGYVRAAAASNIVGAVVDTLLFLTISGFGVAGAWQGQLVGKLLVTGVVIAGVFTVRPIVRRRRLRASLVRGLEESARGDVAYLGDFGESA